MVAEGAIVMEAEDLPSWRQRPKYGTFRQLACLSRGGVCATLAVRAARGSTIHECVVDNRLHFQTLAEHCLSAEKRTEKASACDPG